MNPFWKIYVRALIKLATNLLAPRVSHAVAVQKRKPAKTLDATQNLEVKVFYNALMLFFFKEMSYIENTILTKVHFQESVLIQLKD